MMRTLLFLFFVTIGFAVNAQSSASYYFNAASKEFIHSEFDKAISDVEDGLKKYPNDPKLNALLEKIKEEKEKKKKNDNKDQQKKNDPENKNQDKDKDQKNDNSQNNKDENKDKQDQNKDQNKENNKDQNQDKNKQKEQPQKPEERQGQMSPQQIKQLLETMNNEEAKTQKKVNAQKVKGKKVNNEKDW